MSTIAERLTTIDTKLNSILTNTNTQLTAKGEQTVSDLSDIPGAVAGIEKGNLTNEEYAEANNDLDTILEGTTLATIYPPDWAQIGYNNTPSFILKAFDYAKSIYDSWDATETSLNSKFSNNTNIIIFPGVDTSNVTSMVGTFGNDTNLVSVGPLNTSNVTNMATCFNGCFALQDIPVFNTSKCINLNNLVLSNYALTNQSIDNILQMCINSKSDGYIGTKTLYGVGMRSTYQPAATIQTLPHYQAFLNAGWTIGY